MRRNGAFALANGFLITYLSLTHHVVAYLYTHRVYGECERYLDKMMMRPGERDGRGIGICAALLGLELAACSSRLGRANQFMCSRTFRYVYVGLRTRSGKGDQSLEIVARWKFMSVRASNGLLTLNGWPFRASLSVLNEDEHSNAVR